MTTPSPAPDPALAPAGPMRQLRFIRPPGATELVLVRHGESAAADLNSDYPLLNGHGNPELHDEGVRQAERVAARLALEPVAAIYVTPLRRTAQTAAPLAARLGLTPLVEEDLREVHLGEWEGPQFRFHMTAGHPLALKALQEESWDSIPGAEPVEQFAVRVRRGLTKVASRHPDQLVAVFTHGGVIGRALAEATGARGFAFADVDNASITRLVIDGDRWKVRSFNDVAHLES